MTSPWEFKIHITNLGPATVRVVVDLPQYPDVAAVGIDLPGREGRVVGMRVNLPTLAALRGALKKIEAWTRDPNLNRESLWAIVGDVHEVAEAALSTPAEGVDGASHA